MGGDHPAAGRTPHRGIINSKQAAIGVAEEEWHHNGDNSGPFSPRQTLSGPATTSNRPPMPQESFHLFFPWNDHMMPLKNVTETEAGWIRDGPPKVRVARREPWNPVGILLPLEKTTVIGTTQD